MGSSEFDRVADPTEYVLQLLQVYLFTLQIIMDPILAQEQLGRVRHKEESFEVKTARWTRDLSYFPSSFHQYLAWPKRMHHLAFDGIMSSEDFLGQPRTNTST